jgi:hypothetical protein
VQDHYSRIGKANPNTIFSVGEITMISIYFFTACISVNEPPKNIAGNQCNMKK